MGVRQADTVDTGVLGASFSIPGRSDIPSEQTSHKVLIASLNLQAEPEWVCIPQKQESVFLRCTITNSSEFTLLPGEASVFVDDNFVSRTRMEHVPSSESFKVPLGTDSAMRVTYAPVRAYKRTTTPSGFAFPGRQKEPRQNIMAYSQRITIRNSRTAAVPAVRVLDHVPVSNDSKVKVNVVAPRGLKNETVSKEDVGEKRSSQLLSWVELRKGVQARWAPADVGGEGAIEWTCAIDAGREVELELGWEVSAPVGTNWKTL